MNPCPQCGAPLRWIPEGNYWNCDRCGNRLAPSAAPPTPQPDTYPPPMQQGGPQQHGYPPQQQHGYPPQGYPPQGYGHYPQHGPPRGKGKLIAIILVGVALAAGGIVLAVVLSKKGSDGGGGGGGLDSPEALGKATVEALAAGDTDKLSALMPTLELIDGAVECPEADRAKLAEMNKAGMEESKKKAAENARMMKGSGATLKSGKLNEHKQEVKVGDPSGPEGHCKAKQAGTFTSYDVEVEYTAPADKSRQTYSTMYGVLILDGKYYLVDTGGVPTEIREAAGGGTTPTTPDTPPSGAADLAAVTSEIDALRAEACACKDAACGDAVMAKLAELGNKYRDTPAIQNDANLKAKAEELTKCIVAVKTAEPKPPEPPPIPPPPDPNTPPPTPTPGKGLPECEAYAKAAERFIKCSKVPKQSRDAVQTAVDTMRKNWGDPATMSADMRKSAAETCTTLEKSMKDAAKAIGCK